MKHHWLLFTWALIAINIANAGKIEYRPGGERFACTWDRFYAGDHEPELDDPLIAAGQNMTLPICEAVSNPDIKMRRYAIGALGYIGDPRALPTLEQILLNTEEIYYFRGDAMHAIYQIDNDLGKKYAVNLGHQHEYLTRLSRDIIKDEASLTQPTGH